MVFAMCTLWAAHVVTTATRLVPLLTTFTVELIPSIYIMSEANVIYIITDNITNLQKIILFYNALLRRL